jgi:hypothetical protein
MKLFKLFSYLIIFLIISSCAYDREPKNKYKLNNALNSVVCLNCRQHGAGTVYDFSVIKTTLDITKGKIDKIELEAYLKIHYRFVGYSSNPSTDYFVLPKKAFTLSNSTISYETEWCFGGANAVDLTVELYTGKGMKSDPYTYTIERPVGAK